MASPKISLSMRTDGKLESGELEPTVGGGLEIEYNPLTAKLSFDYSSPDSLGVKLEGDYKLKWTGTQLDAQAQLGIGKDGWKFGDSLTLAIGKTISTTISHELSPQTGNTFSASLRLSF
jgi:hypothetical protein